MRVSRAFGVFALASLAALALAACKGGSSGGGGGPVPTTGPSSSPFKDTVVYVANSAVNTVTGYVASQTSAAIKISTGVSSPFALTVDGKNNLYVDNCQPCIPGHGSTSTITVYAQGTTTPAYTISAGLSKPVAMAVAPNGTLYVANQQTSTVTSYAAGSNSVALTIATGVAMPEGIAVDGSGNVYVANGAFFPGSVTVYSSAGALVRTLPAAAVQNVAVDGIGRVYISNCNVTCGNGSGQDSIIVYAPNGTTVAYNVFASISFPTFMAFDSNNDLYVANNALGTGNNVVEYGAGTATPIATIDAPGPSGLAVDKHNIVYVTDGPGPTGAPYNQLSEYHDGQILTVTSGIASPLGVAITNAP